MLEKYDRQKYLKWDGGFETFCHTGGFVSIGGTMKTLFLTVFALVVSTTAMADFPESVLLIPEAVYTPTGFDDNDNVQFVFEGKFPNSCYRAGLTTHEVDLEKKRVIVNNNAFYYGSGICLTMLVPYVKEVGLGLMPKGEYKIFFREQADNDVQNDQLIEMGKIGVRAAVTSDPDDYLYAPVDNVWLKKVDGNLKLTIQGGWPNTCMSMDRVEVSRKNNTIVVLPVAKMGTVNCALPIVPIPYELTVPVKEMGEGRVLVHVRSLSGKALNRVLDLPEEQ